MALVNDDFTWFYGEHFHIQIIYIFSSDNRAITAIPPPIVVNHTTVNYMFTTELRNFFPFGKLLCTVADLVACTSLDLVLPIVWQRCRGNSWNLHGRKKGGPLLESPKGELIRSEAVSNILRLYFIWKFNKSEKRGNTSAVCVLSSSG